MTPALRSRARSGRAPLRTFARYLLIESPGWVLAALLAVLAEKWLGLSRGAAILLVAFWVGKDLLLYRWLRTAYQDAAPSESDKLVGAEAVVQVALDPVGLVRLGPELWRAEAPHEGPVPPGCKVRVLAVRGLLLEVEPTPRASRSTPSRSR